MRRMTGFLSLLLVMGCIINIHYVQAAEAFPEKNVEFVVQYAPGGGWDAYARGMAPYLKKHLPGNFNVIVRNVAGAGGRVGNTFVYKSRPDGYTVGMASIPGALVTGMVEKVEYDLTKVEWIGTFVLTPALLCTRGNSAINTWNDFKAAAGGGNLKECTTGIGNTLDLIETIALAKAGIKYKTIGGYKGAPEAALGVVRGDGEFITLPGKGFSEDFVKKGDLKPILALGKDRIDIYPQVPSAAEVGLTPLPEYNRCIFAPPGTPKERVMVWAEALKKALQEPELIKWAEETQEGSLWKSAEDTSKMIDQQVKIFGEFVNIIKARLGGI